MKQELSPSLTFIRSLIRKGDVTAVDPIIISYPSVPERMTQHQTNGTKLQECLCFKKSLLPKMEEMHLPLLPLKPVRMVVDLEGEPVDPVDRVVEMIEDPEEDLEDPAAAVAAAVDHHPFSAKWHTPLVY